MSRDRDFWRSRYVSAPRRARGGIRARSKRGSFADKWWARRWVEFLEGYGLGSRLSRGRNYARLGQVLDITVGPGEVAARVQGSRVRPYRVTIHMKTLSPAQWKKVAALVARRPLLAAKLLAGEMPPEIDEVFAEAGLSLFPSGRKDLSTDCSCPDWENPCKHIAAVYYLLGEEFDRDPFLIFRLRGIERGDLASLVAGGPAEGEAARRKGRRAGPAHGAGRTGRHVTKSAFRAGDGPPGSPEGLPADAEAFWGVAAGEARGAGPARGGGEVRGGQEARSAGQASAAGEAGGGARAGLDWDARVPLVPASLPKRLGSFPFWRGREDFIAAMEDIYRRASEVGLRVFLGGEPEEEA